MKLYRVMKLDADGKPLVGTRGYMLGVRPTDPNNKDPKRRSDVAAVNPGELVHLGEGLSTWVFSGKLKIRATEALFEIESDDLGAELAPFPDHGFHCLIQPSAPMALGAFQQALAATRDLWRRVQ